MRFRGQLGRLLDHRLLGLDLRGDVGHVRPVFGDFALGLGKSGRVVALVDAREQGAGRHELVVGDRHVDDLAGNQRADGDRTPVDEGVVGGCVVLRSEPP